MPAANDVWYIDNYDREITQIAAFGEVSYNFTDKLKVTGGARWFEYDRLTVNDQQWPPGLPVEAILLDGETAFVEEGTESDTIFKLGLSYTMDDDKMFYGLVSEGFRLGGANNPKAVRVGFVPELYKPDKLTNYEIGMKSQWLDNRLQVNATVFHMVWEDIQLNIDSDQSGLWWLTGQANGGGGENTGIELDADWQATDNLRISASLYKGDAEYTDDYITDEGVQELTAGSSMPDSPDEKATLALDYTFRQVLGGDMWIRADVYYRGPMYSANWRAEEANPESPDYVEGATFDVDSFTKTNLQIGYDSGESWTATLMVRNLTNERANTFTGNGASEYGEYWGHTGFGETNNLARPRTISFRATWNF